MPALAKRSQYPVHQFAEEHKLFKARALVTSRRRLRDAAELRASGEVACSRIREFAWDVGTELREEQPNRWMAPIARDVLGINEHTGWAIISGLSTSVSTTTVDTIARFTGIPIGVFYDPEL